MKKNFPLLFLGLIFCYSLSISYTLVKKNALSKIFVECEENIPCNEKEAEKNVEPILDNYEKPLSLIINNGHFLQSVKHKMYLELNYAQPYISYIFNPPELFV
ncbi:MAG: hypothetical protein WAT79_14820 [Saprospiraceae bacterium]